jgi:hypothetical protein
VILISGAFEAPVARAVRAVQAAREGASISSRRCSAAPEDVLGAGVGAIAALMLKLTSSLALKRHIEA